MPNDAKLGMVFGVGLVIIVAVIFFRRDTTAIDAFATIPKSAPAVTQPPRDGNAATPGRDAAPSGGQKYVVEDGDTLIGISRRYYGTGEKFDLIYQANREQLGAPDRLRPGMVLTIPEAH
jgi:nucleoid-associated protein YgaU